MKILLCLLLMNLTSFPAIAAGINPFARQCNDLGSLNINSPVFQHFVPGGFWRDTKMAHMYLQALHGQFDIKSSSDQASSFDVYDRSAIVLAAIVKHDLVLLRRFYSQQVSAYFIDTGWSTVTYAASCNFEKGVVFILNKGVDPNVGRGAGPFNIAMIYGNGALAQELLDHGYLIDQKYKRCRSSKFIAEHSKAKISNAIYAAVKAANCRARDP